MESKEQPLVSVCCLVYNHAPFLRECFEGFVMQKTNFPIEILVHDDASTDGSQEIIREYTFKYPEIFKPIYQKENQHSKGGGIMMKYQFPRTKGKYIALCEGDDYWIDPYKLQKQVDFLEGNPDYGFCYTDFNRFNEIGKILDVSCFQNMLYIRSLNFREHLLTQGYLAPMTWVFSKRLILNDFHCDSHATDDSYVWALQFFLKTKVKYIPESTAVYRIHMGSASRQIVPSSHIKYRKGVYDIQYDFAQKYIENNAELLIAIRVNEILELLPIARKNSLESEMKYFILEAQKYNLNIEPLLSLCNEVEYAGKVKSSKAYIIGKFLIRPFSFIKYKIINKWYGTR